jgi:hypothetical protein
MARKPKPISVTFPSLEDYRAMIALERSKGILHGLKLALRSAEIERRAWVGHPTDPWVADVIGNVSVRIRRAIKRRKTP